jgi:hypothetical protein
VELPDGDMEMSKHVAVWLVNINRHCCDIHFCDINCASVGHNRNKTIKRHYSRRFPASAYELLLKQHGQYIGHFFKKNKLLFLSALEKIKKKSNTPDLPIYSVISNLSKVSPVNTKLPTILLKIPAINEFHKLSHYHSLLCAVHRPGTETTECLCVQFSSRVRKQAEIL